MRKVALITMMCSVIFVLSCGASRQPVSPEESTEVNATASEATPTNLNKTEEQPTTEATQATEATANDAVPSEPSADVRNEEPEAQTAGDAATEEENEAIADIPADFFRCEVRIKLTSSAFDAQAIGPTLEEARDNAVDEACAIPCAAQIADKGFSEDESEEALDQCTEVCVSDSTVLAGICWQNGVSVYTEGEWDENGDPAPTNGDETFEIKQGQ